MWFVLVRWFVSKEEDDHVSFSSLILNLCCGTVGSGLYGRAGLSSGSVDRSSHQPLVQVIVRSQCLCLRLRLCLCLCLCLCAWPQRANALSLGKALSGMCVQSVCAGGVVVPRAGSQERPQFPPGRRKAQKLTINSREPK